MTGNVILRVATKLLAPYILLFALYVQFHGDLGPGGGFQAGVIFGAGIILYAIVYGLAHARRVMPPGLVRFCSAAGVLLFAGVGVLALVQGGNFLDYNALAHDPHHGQHWGIFFVELGVFTTVFGTMVAIFYSVAGRKGLD